MDLALLIIAARTILGKAGTPTVGTRPPISKAEVPQCASGEKLVYDSASDRYFCMPKGFN